MTGQKRISKGRVKMPRPTEVHDDTPTRGEAERQHLKDELDELLDEVDAVLEENAEAFVRSFVQKGGQ